VHSYSLRNAITGSTALAQWAGHQQAIKATAANKMAIPKIVGGSVAPIP